MNSHTRPPVIALLVESGRNVVSMIAITAERFGELLAAEARLAAVEAERDSQDAAASYWYGKWIEASVERERDLARQTIKWLHGRVDEEIARCDAAEARLAAVEALCEGFTDDYPESGRFLSVEKIRAAARGDAQDRAAEGIGDRG